MAALFSFHLIFPGRQAKFKCVVCVHMVQTLRTFFPMALNSRVFHELMICTCAFSLPLPLFLWILYLFPFGCQQDSCKSLPVFVYFFWCSHPLVELTVLKAKTSLSVSTPVPTPYLLFACLQRPWDIASGKEGYVRTFRTEQEGLKRHCGLWNFTTSLHVSFFLADMVSTSANF